ncbi:unnamed protein product [Blumeria hordei]|uniref:Uncharacterized protein n=1 Tax=Blumeria hordei TaxID=2867405 RepID=A0A383UJZ5_BLUHO|nr:unnamed protein product [Blumeria hordei]
MSGPSVSAIPNTILNPQESASSTNLPSACTVEKFEKETSSFQKRLHSIPNGGVVESENENERLPKTSAYKIDDTRPKFYDHLGSTIHNLPLRLDGTNERPEKAHLPQPTITSEASSVSQLSANASFSPDRPNPKPIHTVSIEEDAENDDDVPAVVPLHYYHQTQLSENLGPPPTGSEENNEEGRTINRHLSPTSQLRARIFSQRPASASANTELRPKSRPGARHSSGSPHLGHRAQSAQSGRSTDGRPISYVDLANTSYPQGSPATVSLDNSQLRSVIGSNASLLSTAKTIEMYRQNVKKLNDAETQYAFALFLTKAAQEAGLNQESNTIARKSHPRQSSRDLDNQDNEQPSSSPQELLQEAKNILQKLANQSYPFAQYYLADGYASGLFNKGKGDYSNAFPLFIAASKHGHAESGYRAALCYEFGWGCRKDFAKAVQFYRQSASKNHPGSMTRLGRACLSGDLGMSGMNKHREGLKWLKRATESADQQYNAAPYHLGILYETGYGDDVFKDEVYAAQLLTKAADLGHSEASFRLGDAYEHGRLSCPRDPALSVHFYTNAAQAGHSGAMMALCAWYIVGAEAVLEKDENEAYEWARQAAACGLAKAEYAIGYFTEMGIGTRRDPLEANVWYVKAAESGDERASLRLAAIRAAASGGTPMEVIPPRNGSKIKKASISSVKADHHEKECVVM